MMMNTSIDAELLLSHYLKINFNGQHILFHRYNYIKNFIPGGELLNNI